MTRRERTAEWVLGTISVITLAAMFWFFLVAAGEEQPRHASVVVIDTGCMEEAPNDW